MDGMGARKEGDGRPAGDGWASQLATGGGSGGNGGWGSRYPRVLPCTRAGQVPKVRYLAPGQPPPPPSAVRWPGDTRPWARRELRGTCSYRQAPRPPGESACGLGGHLNLETSMDPVHPWMPAQHLYLHLHLLLHRPCPAPRPHQHLKLRLAHRGDGPLAQRPSGQWPVDNWRPPHAKLAGPPCSSPTERAPEVLLHCLAPPPRPPPTNSDADGRVTGPRRCRSVSFSLFPRPLMNGPCCLTAARARSESRKRRFRVHIRVASSPGGHAGERTRRDTTANLDTLFLPSCVGCRPESPKEPGPSTDVSETRPLVQQPRVSPTLAEPLDDTGAGFRESSCVVGPSGSQASQASRA